MTNNGGVIKISGMESIEVTFRGLNERIIMRNEKHC